MWIKGTEIEDQIVEDYKNGMLIHEISEKYSVSEFCVKDCARRKGITNRKKYYSLKSKAEIERLYCVECLLTSEIAERLNEEERVIINYIKNKGLKRPEGYKRKISKRGKAALPKQMTVSHPKNSNLVRTGSAENYHRKSRDGEQKPGTVYCDSDCKKRCYYSNGGTCDYILIEGHSRGCHWSECTKFVDKKGDGKRRLSIPKDK